MLKILGKYNTAKIFTDSIDNATKGQVTSLVNQLFVEGSQIRIMPDTHAGAGCVVGTTMTITDKIVPNLVGVDIGCGMLAMKLKETHIDLPAFDSVIRNYIPSGFAVHKKAIAHSDVKEIKAPVDWIKAEKSLGSLGAGNHFIELDKDCQGNIWLVIHTGSRHLGLETCKYYQDLAYTQLKIKEKCDIKDLRNNLIRELTESGKKKKLAKALKKLNDEYKNQKIDIPYELAYLEGEDFDNYLHDMRIAQEFAKINRSTIAKEILKHAGLHEVESFDTIHNYIDLEHMILRKGAISAQKGERVLIPLNMRDGSLICIGKGNPDWNYSAPHGAGRLMSRSEAKQNISMSDYKDSMEGIYSTCINRSTLDESPFAYKDSEEIKRCIADTVEVIDQIKPIYNFKASE